MTRTPTTPDRSPADAPGLRRLWTARAERVDLVRVRQADAPSPCGSARDGPAIPEPIGPSRRPQTARRQPARLDPSHRPARPARPSGKPPGRPPVAVRADRLGFSTRERFTREHTLITRAILSIRPEPTPFFWSNQSRYVQIKCYIRFLRWRKRVKPFMRPAVLRWRIPPFLRWRKRRQSPMRLNRPYR